MNKLTKALTIALVAGGLYGQAAYAAIAPLNTKGFNAGFESALAEKYSFKSVVASWENFVQENTPIKVRAKQYDALIKLSYDRLLDQRSIPQPASHRTGHDLAIAGYAQAIG